jgi:phage protein D
VPPPADAPETFLARPTILIDQQQYALVNELALSFEMTEQEGGLSTLELRLSNVASNPRGSADLAFDDNAILKLGARIVLYAGDVKGPAEIFRGVITGLEAEFSDEQPPEIVVLAEDLFQQARMTRRTQTHTDTTLEKLAKNVASQLGLKPKVAGFAGTLGTQVQLNESDLAFLRRVLARYDGDMQIVGEELHVSPRRDVQRGALKLRLFDELRRARVIADLADQVSKVTVAGWDARQGRRFAASSSAGALGPGQGAQGARVLGQALAERNHHVAHLAAADEGEAKALADAIFAERARRFVRVEGTAHGNPALRVGTQVSLGELGRRYSNDYYVTRCVHRWDVERGYETDFEAECAFVGVS